MLTRIRLNVISTLSFITSHTKRFQGHLSWQNQHACMYGLIIYKHCIARFLVQHCKQAITSDLHPLTRIRQIPRVHSTASEELMNLNHTCIWNHTQQTTYHASPNMFRCLATVQRIYLQANEVCINFTHHTRWLMHDSRVHQKWESVSEENNSRETLYVDR
jgi:hypothetical protein